MAGVPAPSHWHDAILAEPVHLQPPSLAAAVVRAFTRPNCVARCAVLGDGRILQGGGGGGVAVWSPSCRAIDCHLAPIEDDADDDGMDMVTALCVVGGRQMACGGVCGHVVVFAAGLEPGVVVRPRWQRIHEPEAWP